MLKFDQYGDGFAFYLPGGKKFLKTYSGCVISFVSLFIIAFYSTVQFMKLIEYGDPSIMVSTRDAYFDTDYRFDSKDFKLAFALTAYDADQNPLNKPEYG